MYDVILDERELTLAATIIHMHIPERYRSDLQLKLPWNRQKLVYNRADNGSNMNTDCYRAIRKQRIERANNISKDNRDDFPFVEASRREKNRYRFDIDS